LSNLRAYTARVLKTTWLRSDVDAINQLDRLGQTSGLKDLWGRILMIANTSITGTRIGILPAMLRAASAAALAVIAASPAAYAQITTATNQPAADNSIADIIVTAQRRTESAQDVPISLAVLSPAEMTAMGVTDIKDLPGKIPLLSETQSGPLIYFLRGVGSTSTNINNEPSVATYVDGVYMFGLYSNNLPLNGLERTEVLVGPQGTLFGRNTTGGVIQLVTRDPMSDPALESYVGYANYNTVTLGGYASDKFFGDKLAIGAALDCRHQGDGWGRNTTLGVEAYIYSYCSAQFKTVAQVTETTKITGFYLFGRSYGDPYETQYLPGQTRVDGSVQNNQGRYQAIAGSPNNEASTSNLGYIRVDQELGFADLSSITSYRTTDVIFNYAYSGTPYVIVGAYLPAKTNDISEELQLASVASSRIKWLFGLYYFDGEAKYTPFGLYGAAFSPLLSQQIYSTQENISLAPFGQATLPLGYDTNLTLGARYTDETVKKIDETYYLVSPAGQGPAYTTPNQQTTSSGPTWRVALDHKFTPDIMGYMSYNRGLKSGGYNLSATTNVAPYAPEKLNAYEIGLKNELFNHRLQVNIAAFYYDYKDVQVLSAQENGINTVNAAQETLKGVDGDFTFRATSEWTIWGNAGSLNGKYNSYPNAVGYEPSGAQIVFNAAGKRSPYAPTFTAAVGSTYTIPSPIGNFALNGWVQHQAQEFVGPTNAVGIPAYTLVNASLTWTDDSRRWSVAAWAKNLFDEHFLQGALETAFGGFQVQGAPQTYGLTVSYKMR
jgi:iron complex outermembrane recepter protein